LAARDKSGAGVRTRAARLNSEVVDHGRSLAQLDLDPASLAERDRPLLRAMLTASLRWHHRLDWQLAQLLDRPLARRDRLLGALLRIGLTQLQFLRTPEHAAVAATVAAAAALGLGRARGLVNAVLRRYIREREQLDLRMQAVDVARCSHPAWLLEALQHDWPEDWPSIVEANNAQPPLWLRVNRLKISRDDYLAELGAAGLQAAAAEGLPDALLLSEPLPVSQLPGFADGLVSVQDAAAQRAVELLQPAPGQRVLDACAAPGGKTAHLLERCPALAELVAVDNDRERLAQVQSNLDRLGLGARLVEGDAATPDAWFDGALFDRILVDAPCSATGVVRRHPDIKLLRRATDPASLAQTQMAMLKALWPLLKPGGRLVYATCSVLKAENIDVISAFAVAYPDAVVAEFGSDTHFQLLPGQANTDGFYYACLNSGGGVDG